ncbi:Hypothetical protein D9617_4g003930 [Elsinoe fawcettii]|nr:Hypothetical protein D9617_4g003930 [Elsinoe fawcettii]
MNGICSLHSNAASNMIRKAQCFANYTATLAEEHTTATPNGSMLVTLAHALQYEFDVFEDEKQELRSEPIDVTAMLRPAGNKFLSTSTESISGLHRLTTHLDLEDNSGDESIRIVILHGYITPPAIARLGAILDVDPRFFSTHMDSSKKYGALASLQMSRYGTWQIIKLPMFTIWRHNSRAFRLDSSPELAVTDYSGETNIGLKSGDSVVREVRFHGAHTMSIEQSITIGLTWSDSGLKALLWCDVGSQLSVGQNVAWTDPIAAIFKLSCPLTNILRVMDSLSRGNMEPVTVVLGWLALSIDSVDTILDVLEHEDLPHSSSNNSSSAHEDFEHDITYRLLLSQIRCCVADVLSALSGIPMSSAVKRTSLAQTVMLDSLYRRVYMIRDRHATLMQALERGNNTSAPVTKNSGHARWRQYIESGGTAAVWIIYLGPVLILLYLALSSIMQSRLEVHLGWYRSVVLVILALYFSWHCISQALLLSGRLKRGASMVNIRRPKHDQVGIGLQGYTDTVTNDSSRMKKRAAHSSPRSADLRAPGAQSTSKDPLALESKGRHSPTATDTRKLWWQQLADNGCVLTIDEGSRVVVISGTPGVLVYSYRSQLPLELQFDHISQSRFHRSDRNGIRNDTVSMSIFRFFTIDQKSDTLQEMRSLVQKGMDEYSKSLDKVWARAAGVPVVRGSCVLTSDILAIEQSITVSLQGTDHPWSLLICSDLGNDMNKGPVGPWTRYALQEVSALTAMSIGAASEPSHASYESDASVPKATSADQSDGWAIAQASQILGRRLELSIVAHSPIYSLLDVLKWSCDSATTVVQVIKSNLVRAPLTAVDDHTLSLANALYYRAWLRDMESRLNDNIDDLASCWSTWPHTSDENYLRFMTHEINFALDDARSLLASIERLVKECEHVLSDSINYTLINIAESALKTTQRIEWLTIAAIFYIPVSFTVAWFGMNFSPVSLLGFLWLSSSIIIPILLAVLFIRSTRANDMAESRLREFWG